MSGARATDLQQWLMTGTRDQRFVEDIFAELCNRLLAARVPVARASLHLLVNNPQWLGARIIWRKKTGRAAVESIGYEIRQTAAYDRSPFGAIRHGAAMVRQRVDGEAIEHMNDELLAELRAEGLVDYIAWPLEHTLGKRHMITFASDAPNGSARKRSQRLPAFFRRWRWSARSA